MSNLTTPGLATEQMRTLFFSMQTSVASQVAHMRVAQHFRPEVQEICIEARNAAKVTGHIQGGLPSEALNRHPLSERMKMFIEARGPLLDHEADGVTYRYHTASGARPMPSETLKEMERKVDVLNVFHRRYSEANRALQGAKSDLYGVKDNAVADRLKEYATATAGYHKARVGYHEQIRSYLGDRASLASQGFDVSRTDSRAQYHRVFDSFMRDCHSVLKQNAPDVRKDMKAGAKRDMALG